MKLKLFSVALVIFKFTACVSLARIKPCIIIKYNYFYNSYRTSTRRN